MLHAGRLRERITIRREVNASDGKGGFTRSWTDLAANLPAEVINQGGREALLAQSLLGMESYRIVIRRRDDIVAKDQIKWGAKELNIRSVGPDPLLPRDATQIFADTGGPQGA